MVILTLTLTYHGHFLPKAKPINYNYVLTEHGSIQKLTGVWVRLAAN